MSAVGLTETFRPGDEARVERALADLRELSVSRLRTALDPALLAPAEGRPFYQRLLARLAEEVELVVALPSSGATSLVELVDAVAPLLPAGASLELGGEADGLASGPPSWKPEHLAALGAAAAAARALGRRVVVGGAGACDPSWLRAAAEALRHADAVAVQALPGTFAHCRSAQEAVASGRRGLAELGLAREVWIGAAGHTTATHDERGQLRAFLDALDAGADRVYWACLHDGEAERACAEAALDARRLHLGLRRADGSPKLLLRTWREEGLDGVQAARFLTERRNAAPRRHVVVTGGAGFVGTNLADRLLRQGQPVTLLDNLSRPGVERNLRWLRAEHGDLLRVEVGDVRDPAVLREVVKGAGAVFHLAAQVAAPSSLAAPVHDFRVNAEGTLNVLEAARASPEPPAVLFTSTREVYGDLADVALRQTATRHEPVSLALRRDGVSEDRGLACHGPHGCSKGAADQYVLDWARSFGLRATALRLGCAYGPHQQGGEDQGSVAHLVREAAARRPITVRGDGRQVRDLLFVEDLVDALLIARERIEALTGRAYNLGGGPSHAASVLELLRLVGELEGAPPRVVHEPPRAGEPRWWVSDVRRFAAATGWQPCVSVREGVERLHAWIRRARAGPAAREVRP